MKLKKQFKYEGKAVNEIMVGMEKVTNGMNETDVRYATHGQNLQHRHRIRALDWLQMLRR